MRCERARRKIQVWLDRSGASPMPPEIRAHVRECGDCRAFITRWNAIELRLQTLREETPRLSSDFSLSLQARLNTERAQMARPASIRRWPFAVAGASMLLLLALLLFQRLGDARQLAARTAHNVHGWSAARNPPAASSLAVTRPVPPNARLAAPSLSPDLPLANTTR